MAIGVASAPLRADDLPADRVTLRGCLLAASAAKRGPETCIGAVQNPCMTKRDGETTLGMELCAGRETAVWDERLNAAYKAALASSAGTVDAERGARRLKGADILRDTQRSWIVFRDKKCDAAGLSMEGGTGAALLASDCILSETARQAIWLEAFSER